MTVGSGCISLFCFPQLLWFLWIMKFRNETFDTYDSMNFWYDVSLALIFPFGWLNYHPRLKSNPRVLKLNELLEQNRFVSRYSFISSRSHYITRRKKHLCKMHKNLSLRSKRLHCNVLPSYMRSSLFASFAWSAIRYVWVYINHWS